MIYPQSKEESGPHYWAVLHNVAAQYPDNPTRDDKIHHKHLVNAIVQKFTCENCVKNAMDFISSNPPALDNKETFMKWMCRFHNHANADSGKIPVDCDSFLQNSLNRNGGCKTCAIAPSRISAPLPSMAAMGTPIPTIPKLDPAFESVLNWYDRYPSLKRNVTLVNNESATPIVPATAAPATVAVAPAQPGDDLAARYPTLAGFESPVDTNREEELDGILKPLDSIYATPANFVDIKPHEFNLAYTPEMVTNLVSLITQMYLSNFGALATTLVSSLGIFGVSVFAKGSLSHYDRIFLQNIVGSLLFHSLNFINPILKNEIVPSAQKFFEGVTSMDFEKIKSSVLLNYASAEDHTTNELMEMMKVKTGMVDMDKLKVPKASYMGAFSAGDSSIRGMQMASQGAYDTRMGGVGSLGFGGGSGPSKDALERLYNDRGRSSGLRDYGIGGRVGSPNYGLMDAMDDKYGFILDNTLL